MEKLTERALLVGVHTGSRDSLHDTTEESMRELAQLAETAGAEVIGELVQNRPAPENATYIGEGKVAEVREFCECQDIDIVIFDDELSPSQVRNLTRDIGVKISDRSGLIMDIFAQRASTNEGKLQVELAQLRYILPRLSGLGTSLSRLGGGIGTRGPGETKLESDRRHIHRRIAALSEELHEVVQNRETQRRARIKEGIQQVAIVGYTNAGKSTLLNKLTDAGVLSEDMLFATLDPTARRLTLHDGTTLLLIDTVGFIRKLPHHLIKAFRSTLEESLLSDVLVHIADASSPEVLNHIDIVNNLIHELGASDKPMLTVLNKIDKAENLPPLPGCIEISAKTGEGLDNFLEMLRLSLPSQRVTVNVLIPFDRGGVVARLYDIAKVESEEYVAEGTRMRVIVDTRGLSEISEWIT